MSRTASMKITHRVVSVKRHTLGYVINSRNYTVSQARKFAQQGRLSGVRVVGNHIQSIPGRRGPLSNLPLKLQNVR